MTTSFRGLGYLLAFAAGIFVFWFSQAMQSSIPRTLHPLMHPRTIEQITIVPEQNWILDYELSAISLNVDSRREYVLLLFTPLGENSQPPMQNSYTTAFELKGLTEPGASLIFVLRPEKIEPDPKLQYISLMEFTGSLFGSKRIELTNKLELKACELNFNKNSKGISYKFEGKKWHQK